MGNNYILYMHISPSNKYYIGITSQNIEKRWQNGYGYKTNKHFWRAIQKYGWDNFEHKILNQNLTKAKAEELEIYYIQKYNSTNVDFGYNKAPGGKLLPKFTEETKKKMSENHADFKLGNHPQAKRVYKYEKETGKYICGYDCVASASIETNISRESIAGIARGDELTAGGFRWSYEKQDNIGEFNYINSRSIKVYQYGLDGLYLSCCNSFLEAKEKYGATLHNKDFEKSNVKMSHGYLWSLSKFEKIAPYRYKDCKPVKQILNGEVLHIYNSVKEAVKETGITTIAQAARGVQKHAGGYEWIYC